MTRVTERPNRWRVVAEVTCVLALALSTMTVAGAWARQLGGTSEPAPIDFAHFYALGTATADVDERQALVDHDAWQRLMGRIVPDRDDYPRVYGPQTGLWFAPWSLLPLSVAYVGWNVLSLLVWAWCAFRLISRFEPGLVADRPLIILAALAFPGLTHVLMNGHATVVAVAGLTVATLGMGRGTALMAGLGLGILSFKPTLFLPMVAIAFVGGEIAMCVVAGVAAVGLLLVTVPLLGWAPLHAYFTTLVALADAPDVVASPSIMASLRTLSYQVLPDSIAGAGYLAFAVVAVLLAASVWRRTPDPLDRFGVASVATALAAPHVYNYDLVITLPALIGSFAYVLKRQPGWQITAVGTTAAYIAPALPLFVSSPISVTAITQSVWLVEQVWRNTVSGRDQHGIRGDPRPR